MSFLGIDIGTSGCKSVAFDERGKIIVSHYREYDTFRDATGRSEIDARDVWDKIAETIRVCAEATQVDPNLRSKRARFRSARRGRGDGAARGGFHAR